MLKATFHKSFLILTGLIAVTQSEHLFESLLQRRAKPISWKWSNDLNNLMKSPDPQRRRRFLPEASVEKWWRTMAPQKDLKLNAVINKETLTPVEDTFFRPSHFHRPKMQRLTDTSAKQNEGVVVVNSTQTFREETNFRQDSRFDNLETLSLPVEPFDKDNRVFLAAQYLSPTEKTTYFGEQNFPGSFGDIQTIPQQREVENEDYSVLRTENNEGLFSPQHDVDSELLRKFIIHERHKPSKFEHQSASQRLKDSGRTRNDFRLTNDKLMSSVEYIVPSVEHVVSHVEYADNITGSDEIPTAMSYVEYITPTVEFVEPEVEYISPELNTSESSIEDEGTWITEEEIVPDEESLANENQYTIERYENEGLKTKEDGMRFRIVGLRREQIRVRRNHGRNQEVGVPNEDYPTLEALPVVQFYCRDYLPGYYVDITTRCQVFHICHENGQRSSFLCPVGTVFNQEFLVCDWWYNVDCELSSKYYNSESLQAYSTNNEKQRIISQDEDGKKEPVVVRKESASRKPILSKSSVSSSSNIGERKRSGSDNSRSRLTNLSQKAVNYPVGYAILLREYMKNTIGSSDSRNRVRNDQNVFYSNKKENADTKSAKFISEKTKTPKTHGENVATIPATKHYSNVSKYPRPNTRFLGGSKPYSLSSSIHSQNRNLGYKREQETDRNLEPYIRKSYEPSLFETRNKSRNVFRSSIQGKVLDKAEKPSSLGKENQRNVFVNRKQTASQDLIKAQGNIHSNPKRIHKGTTEANHYRFIIDPKEAIRPASGKQYSILEQHIKKNSSAIKFRHAESTIKHIKPQINKASFTINGNNGKISKISSKEDGSRLKYYSSVTYARDNLASHSAPGVSQTIHPPQGFNHRYGERLKSRSVPSTDEKFTPSNETRKEYILEGPVRYYPAFVPENPQRKLYFNNTNQLKNNLNGSNNSYGSLLLESKSAFKFAKLNELLNKKQMLGNKTNLVYLQNGKGVNSDERDKKKMNVRVENKTILKQERSILLDENATSEMSKNKTVLNIHHDNETSLTALKSEHSNLVNDSRNYNSTHNISQKKNVKYTFVDFTTQNATKVNNTHGGYKIVKVPKIVNPKNQVTFYNEGNQKAINVTHEVQRLNQTFASKGALINASRAT